MGDVSPDFTRVRNLLERAVADESQTAPKLREITTSLEKLDDLQQADRVRQLRSLESALSGLESELSGPDRRDVVEAREHLAAYRRRWEE